MIRNIFVTLIFFFGPALLMFVVRNVFLFWRAKHAQKKQEPEIINITPSNQTPPSRFFLASAIAVGFIFAFFAWSQLSDTSPITNQTYIPAHINAQGDLVPQQRIPQAPASKP
jgi:hypothetical protein